MGSPARTSRLGTPTIRALGDNLDARESLGPPSLNIFECVIFRLSSADMPVKVPDNIVHSPSIEGGRPGILPGSRSHGAWMRHFATCEMASPVSAPVAQTFPKGSMLDDLSPATSPRRRRVPWTGPY